MNGGMMTKKCLGHNVLMEERHSKTKVDESGQPKAYFGHMEDGKMCFGIKEEIPENVSVEEVRDFAEEMKEDAETSSKVEDKKLNLLNDIANDVNKSGGKVEDKPMTRLDWNEKEWIKGLGVFSSHARSEGMPPKEAFETMSIWGWMDLAYGDMPGYEEWKEKAKKRIK